MKSLKALLIVTLMTASVAAMAEGSDGGDKVMARMDAARDTSMAYYQQAEKAQAVAAGKQASDSVERTN
ncbi:co-regulatory protein PtrA N-terminal domain-containing protein [Pseudomonas sp. MWU12-2037]|uniref:co-regulatory protein PtrA N-terminal domain-containing protein n=1 Tax=Pseudomonas sp. MWU12-2037 TaxID=2928690 RepID=UPI0020101918|nr:co-regulatory protein PtrA N-terminal domain-containing protein [Pseudomonas sp. MWU12-2037]